jgi:hypothetical protein
VWKCATWKSGSWKEMKNSSEQVFRLTRSRGDVEGVFLSGVICRTDLQDATMLGPSVFTFGESKFCCVGHKFNSFLVCSGPNESAS